MNHLTKDELKSLLKEIPSQRSRLMILVAYLHGLRVSEVISLTGSSVRDGYLTVKRLKGSLKTSQPLVSSSDSLMDESAYLPKLAEAVGSNGLLFPMTRNGVYKLMQRYGERAGIPKHKLHPHALKHGCAMASIKVAGIESVRQYLGHRSLSSTGEYLRVNDETASEAVKGAFQ